MYLIRKYLHQTLAYALYGEYLVNIKHYYGDDYDEKSQFTGYEKDEETGLSQAKNRYYDSKLSIFYSVDALAEKFPNISGYAYCGNNPVMFIDPDGRSAKVAMNKHTQTITISAKMIFYGVAANSNLASQTAADIQNVWNAANGSVAIDGVTYSVVFNVTGEYRNTEGFINSTKFAFEKGLNSDVRNNFVDVKEKVAGGVSNMIQGGNTGTFQLNNIDGAGTTTEAHEFGHSLGLWPGTADGHPANVDIRGQGQPGIMYPRGTLVDPQYQYNPNVQAGQTGGTLNPNLRQATQADIDALGLNKLKYDSNGNSQLGTNTSSW
jgi:RHS repeat-associated protein